MALPTIKSNTEISGLFSHGRRFSNRYVGFIVKEQSNHSNSTSNEHDPRGRVAFIAGKKHGNAVWRNSAKRRMREIYRQNSDKLAGLDVLFVAKSSILGDSYSKVLEACERTIDKIMEERR